MPSGMNGGGAEGALLKVETLRKYFDVSKPFLNRLIEGEGRQVLKAVDGVSFVIPRGKTFSLVGESGCGKSTIAQCVVGLYKPTSGFVGFDGVDVSQLAQRRMMPYRRRVQMIFQDPYASLNPRWRVSDIIAEPIREHNLLSAETDIRSRVEELLNLVGMAARDRFAYPHEFSGGQRQRISIARALASHPDFLVCDEPTSALDVSVQAQILNLMMDLQRELGLTYMFISHNLAVVYHVSDFVGVMYLGRIVEYGSARTLFRHPRHPYTRLLLETVPNIRSRGQERLPLAGEVPSPIHPPSGCHFHPRCPFAEERCRREAPQPIVVEGMVVACHGVEEDRLPAPVPAQPPPPLLRDRPGGDAAQ